MFSLVYIALLCLSYFALLFIPLITGATTRRQPFDEPCAFAIPEPPHRAAGQQQPPDYDNANFFRPKWGQLNTISRECQCLLG